MSRACSLCSKRIPKADVENKATLKESDLERELNDIVIFSLETPSDHECRLCKACVNLVEERMKIKTKLRKLDQRIRTRYFDALYKMCCTRSRTTRMMEGHWEERRTERRKVDTFRETRTWATSDIKCENVSSCMKFGKDEEISLFKCEEEVAKREFQETISKEEECVSMYKIEKELWDDDDDIKFDTNVKEENM